MSEQANRRITGAVACLGRALESDGSETLMGRAPNAVSALDQKRHLLQSPIVDSIFYR